MTRKIAASVLLTAAALALGGCVSLGVANRDQLDPGSAASRTGVEYRLGFTQMTGTVTWRLVDCQTPTIAVKTEGVTVGSAADPERRYVIDMTSLSSPLKTSALRVERWPNGQLRAINASAEDRSAAVLGSLISSAVRIFSPVPGGGGPAAASHCTPDTERALADAQRLKGELATKTAAVNAATADLNAITERVRQAGGAVDSLTANLLANAVTALDQRRREQLVLQTQLDRALEKITAKIEFRWPQRASDSGPHFLELPAETASEWFTNGPATARIRSGSCVQLWLSRASGGGAGAVDAPDESILEGIRYRDPEPGLFEVRVTKDAQVPPAGGPPCLASPGSETVLSMPVDVLQFGRVMTLPFHNAMFQSNALEATWDEQGRLTMASYGVRTSSAETAAALLSTGVDQVRAGIAANRDAETQRLVRENALLQAQIANAELQGKLNPPVLDERSQAIANFDAQRALDNAEAAAINAQIALQRARAEAAAAGIAVN